MSGVSTDRRIFLFLTITLLGFLGWWGNTLITGLVSRGGERGLDDPDSLRTLSLVMTDSDWLDSLAGKLADQMRNKTTAFSPPPAAAVVVAPPPAAVPQPCPSAPVVTSECQRLETMGMAYRQMQKDYCIRTYLGGDHLPSDVYRKVKYLGVERDNRSIPLELFVYTSNDKVSENVAAHAVWERDIVESFDRAARRVSEVKKLPLSDLYFMDLGTNLGTFSIFMASSGINVISFEPSPLNEPALRSSICANDFTDRVTLYPLAVGKDPGVCEIWSWEHVNKGNGVVRCDTSQPVPGNGDSDWSLIGKMETVRLDDVLYCPGSMVVERMAALKMDIEGFEWLMLQGGQEFFRAAKIPYIMMEWCCNLPDGHQKHIENFFKDLGYMFPKTLDFFSRDFGGMVMNGDGRAENAVMVHKDYAN